MRHPRWGTGCSSLQRVPSGFLQSSFTYWPISVHVLLALAQVGQQLELLDRPCLCVMNTQSHHAEVPDLLCRPAGCCLIKALCQEMLRVI